MTPSNLWRLGKQMLVAATPHSTRTSRDSGSTPRRTRSNSALRSCNIWLLKLGHTPALPNSLPTHLHHANRRGSIWKCKHPQCRWSGTTQQSQLLRLPHNGSGGASAPREAPTQAPQRPSSGALLCCGVEHARRGTLKALLIIEHIEIPVVPRARGGCESVWMPVSFGACTGLCDDGCMLSEHKYSRIDVPSKYFVN